MFLHDPVICCLLEAGKAGFRHIDAVRCGGKDMTFFQQIIRRVMAFMSGRNGIDTLAFASLAVSLALQMIGSVTGTGLLLLLSLALYGWTLFRVFSRKTYKRQEENRRFVLCGETRKRKPGSCSCG